ncbi:accessory gland protein Acp29AB-like [Drosophila ficusphila]|uniref:accessory gland protein Acp29AB-like n=1 Tax=Drosophila ficusphila TaxID=30025 RepID=UPI001C8ACA54|nr:accessory gland protein Acp29AB-like [Drosophila ficusphila]
MPTIRHIYHQQRSSTCDAQKLNETQAKLDRIEGRQTALEASVDTLKTSVDREGETLKAGLASLEKLLEQKEAASKLLQAKVDRIEGQLAGIAEALSKAIKNLQHSKFERIGDRLLCVGNNSRQKWSLAEEACLQMGGHLATIQNEAELAALEGKLKRNTPYWLGLSDLAEQGQFVSVATGRPAGFFNWRATQPNNFNNNDRCVSLYNSEMYDSVCEDAEHFICEAAF